MLCWQGISDLLCVKLLQTCQMLWNYSVTSVDLIKNSLYLAISGCL